MKDSRLNCNHIWQYFLVGAIIIVMTLIMCTNIYHYCYKMNADIASEAVLARLIWESGEWIPNSWYPSTELRIWGTPNLAALFYGLTSDMNFAMGTACTVMTIVISLSAYFFISQFSFERTQKLAFILLCLVLPNHFVILELLYLFAVYYGIHVIVFFFTLGVYARLISGKKINGLFMSIAVVLSFMMGMQGVRGILILSVPLFATEIFRQLYLIYSKSKWKDKRNLLVAGWCAILPIAGYTGTLLPFSVGQQTSRNIRKGFVKLIDTVLPDVAECLGFSEIGFIGHILVFGLLLIAIAVFLLCIIRILQKRCDDHAIWIYLMLWISTAISMLAVAFTTTDSSQRYYFMILYTIAFGLVYSIKLSKENMKILNNAGYVLTLFLFLFQANTVYLSIMQSDDPYWDAKYEVCKYLEDNEFQTGYASFEIANTMTVLSEGTIRIAAVASVEKMDICKWLSSTEWYVPSMPYESRTAYIVMEAEREAFDTFCKQHQEDIRFDTQIGQFLIYESDYNLSNRE